MDGNAALAALGLLPGASQREIKAAFRRRAKLTHPDLGADGDAFSAVCLAYTVALSAATTRSRAAAAPAVTAGPAPAPVPADAVEAIPVPEEAAPTPTRRSRWIGTSIDRRPEVLDRIDVSVAPPPPSGPRPRRHHWSFDQHLSAALTE